MASIEDPQFNSFHSMAQYITLIPERGIPSHDSHFTFQSPPNPRTTHLFPMSLSLIGYPANRPTVPLDPSFDARVRRHYDIHDGCPGCYSPVHKFTEHPNLLSLRGGDGDGRMRNMSVQTSYVQRRPHFHSFNEDLVSPYYYMSLVRADFTMTLFFDVRGRRVWVRDFLLTWTEIYVYLSLPIPSRIPRRYADSANHYPYNTEYFLACCKPFLTIHEWIAEYGTNRVTRSCFSLVHRSTGFAVATPYMSLEEDATHFLVHRNFDIFGKEGGPHGMLTEMMQHYERWYPDGEQRILVWWEARFDLVYPTKAYIPYKVPDWLWTKPIEQQMRNEVTEIEDDDEDMASDVSSDA